MRKGWIILTGILFVLILGYFLGPRPSRPVYNDSMPVVPDDSAALTRYVMAGEARHKVKPDNEARIVWADSAHGARTRYVLLYLHGFSGSQEEGNPVHRDFAAKYGCNLFLSRLQDHGIDTPDAMFYFSAERLWNSAKEAYAIARRLGDSVIIMGTSTGGSLALQLAATYPDDPIKALILLSPNIAINNSSAWLLDLPWGLQIARAVTGSNYYPASDTSRPSLQYWNSPYRLEALVQLQEMLDSKMNRTTFKEVYQPTLVLYYYKDEKHQDPTVKVSAELSMVDQLGTPPVLKRAIDIPNAGVHVLGSHITSHDVPGVERAIDSFAQQVLHIEPVSGTNKQ